MDFLITGGLGFQGSHLTKSLLDSGASVRVLARDSVHARRNLQRIIGESPNLRVVWGDILHPETLRVHISDVRAVVHLAAQIHVDESIKHPERSVSVNIIGTTNILESARAVGCPVIIGSSCEVYGTALHSLMDENHPLNPTSPYAATKAAADRLAFGWSKVYDLPVVIMRPGNVFGWGQKGGERGALIPRWIESILSGNPMLMYGSGEQSRDWIYVSDVVRAYCAVLNSDPNNWNGQAYNVGTGIPTSVKRIASILCTLSPGATINQIESRPGEVREFMLDSRRIRTSFSWSPIVSIFDGIQQTWEDAKKWGGI